MQIVKSVCDLCHDEFDGTLGQNGFLTLIAHGEEELESYDFCSPDCARETVEMIAKNFTDPEEEKKKEEEDPEPLQEPKRETKGPRLKPVENRPEVLAPEAEIPAAFRQTSDNIYGTSPVTRKV